jgi:NADH-quinone oxidoreductase subunit M
MEWLTNHWLSIVLFFPLLWAVAGIFFPKPGFWALGGTLIEGLLFFPILKGFHISAAELQWSEKLSWIPSVGIQYFIGLDGISFWLVGLVILLMPLVVLSSMGLIVKNEKFFYGILLLSQTAIIGVLFVSKLTLTK